jgi:hypothetical protein
MNSKSLCIVLVVLIGLSQAAVYHSFTVNYDEANVVPVKAAQRSLAIFIGTDWEQLFHEANNSSLSSNQTFDARVITGIAKDFLDIAYHEVGIRHGDPNWTLALTHDQKYIVNGTDTADYKFINNMLYKQAVRLDDARFLPTQQQFQTIREIQKDIAPMIPILDNNIFWERNSWYFILITCLAAESLILLVVLAVIATRTTPSKNEP